jgi:hypothetical protein
MKDNIKIELREHDVTMWSGFRYQNSKLYRALMNMVMNLQVP